MITDCYRTETKTIVCVAASNTKKVNLTLTEDNKDPTFVALNLNEAKRLIEAILAAIVEVK